MADVKVAVRLGRKARVNFRALSAAQIFCHDIANEIGRLVLDWFRHATARR